jgi:hypothetical protein
MTFIQLYNIEKEKNGGNRPLEWLQRVAVAAIVSTDTVYQWALGWRNPNKAAAKMAADELGMDVETLFPNLKNQRQ